MYYLFRLKSFLNIKCSFDCGFFCMINLNFRKHCNPQRRDKSLKLAVLIHSVHSQSRKTGEKKSSYSNNTWRANHRIWRSQVEKDILKEDASRTIHELTETLRIKDSYYINDTSKEKNQLQGFILLKGLSLNHYSGNDIQIHDKWEEVNLYLS